MRDPMSPSPQHEAERPDGPPQFDALLGRWRVLLDGIARRYDLDHDDVDEVEQAVRVRLWRQSERASGNEAVTSSYVYRAVMSAVMDLLRRRRVRMRHAVRLDDVEGELQAGMDGPSHDEIAEALERALSAMDLPRRVVVRLHLEGTDRAEIATMLGWTDAKVRNLLYRGLDDLRETLRKETIR